MTTHTSTYPLSTTPSSLNVVSDHHRHFLFPDQYASRRINSTGKGILIGMLSAFGSALLIAIILVLVYLLRYTTRGRIFLDRIGRPGEFDDEQAFMKEEEEALDQMDDMQRSEYLRAKGRHGMRREETCAMANHHTSIRASEPTRVSTDGHLIVTVPGNTREGRFSMGI
jgi:hypothetical protein